jgi:translation initiation factor 1
MEDYIPIRVQQRHSGKTLTTVEGIVVEHGTRKLGKTFKTTFVCNDIVTEHPEFGEAFYLQGDQSKNTWCFLGEWAGRSRLG